MNNIDQKWLSQLRKGYLELCVLVVLESEKTSYGFAILQRLNHAGIDINEGTLYPLLNRMHGHGWLESNWETPSEGGHPRRFYALTEAGRALLPAMKDHFRRQQSSLSKLTEKS